MILEFHVRHDSAGRPTIEIKMIPPKGIVDESSPIPKVIFCSKKGLCSAFIK